MILEVKLVDLLGGRTDGEEAGWQSSGGLVTLYFFTEMLVTWAHL